LTEYSKLELLKEFENVKIVGPKTIEVHNEQKVIEEALSSPINFPDLASFLGKVRKLLLIINDFTRPTPTQKVLNVLINYIEEETTNFNIIIASGAHRTPTEDELQRILGKYYSSLRERVKFHDSKESNSLIYIGISSFGTPIYINKTIYEYDGMIVIGSSEPHYFAGYTGGRKAFIPGVAGHETITLNHKFALDERSETFALEGNPVHEDMIDIVKKLNICERVFSIQTVVDSEGRICYATAGHIFDSFNEITKHAKKVYSVEIPHKVDIVVALAENPMDVNLYQSHKALENVKLALNDDGIIILVSRCHGGIGPDGFYKLLKECKTPEEAIEKIKGDFKFGYHKAIKLASILSKFNVRVVSELPESALTEVFMEPWSSLEEALKDAVKHKGKDAKILVVRHAGVTVPVLSE